MLQQDKCTQDDYVKLFASSAEPLRWLSETLTGDEELSERVLAAALEQSLKGADCVFREWMVSWARRLIITSCAEIVKPWNSAGSEEFYPLFPIRLDVVDHDRIEALISLPSDVLQERLLRLNSLHRFVFILRMLEGYSRRETSLLLNISDRLCEWVYVQTVETIESDGSQFFADHAAVLGKCEYCSARVGE
jgi:DNA-directed RNA polymerase specialized sigma24 family protein